MELPKTITKTWLKKQQACQSQVNRFTKVFPRGMRLTAANLRKAAISGLQVDWLIELQPLPRLARELALSFNRARIELKNSPYRRAEERAALERRLSYTTQRVLFAEAIIYVLNLDKTQ